MSASDKDVNDFLKAVGPKRSPRSPSFTVQAEVAAVNATLTDIFVDGSTVAVPDVRKFDFTGTLVVGDTVWCLKTGPKYLIIGKLA